MGDLPVSLAQYRTHHSFVRNIETLRAYESWLLSTDRAEGTIRLRMRHMRLIAKNVDLLDLRVDDVEHVLAVHRADRAETRKSWLSSMRLFCRWAMRKGLIGSDPTLDVESIRIPVAVPRVAPDDAVVRALGCATAHQRAMVLLARYGCLRLTELSTLPVKAREGDRLRFVGKGGRERVVGVNDALMGALLAIEPSPTGFYFPGLRAPHMHPQSVHKIIKRITGYNPHSLRHAGATAAYNATHDLRAVQQMLGHSSLVTTQRYLHLDDDALRRVADGTMIRHATPIAA